MRKSPVRERGFSKFVSHGFGWGRRATGFEQFGRELSGPAPVLHDDACGKISVLLKSLGTTLDGLSSGDVRRRRSEFGFNEVAHERPPRWYVRLLRAFNNPFIALLVARRGRLPDAGPEGHLDHRRDGAHQRVAAFCPGVPLQHRGGTAQGHGAEHRDRRPGDRKQHVFRVDGPEIGRSAGHDEL